MKENISLEKAIPLLVEEIEKRRMSIFVGAGCSIPAGLPAWSTLLEKLLTKYNIKTKDSNLLRLAARLERELGSLKFREEIIDHLTVAPDVTTPVCSSLVSLELNSYITTNYDHVLENSFRKKSIEPSIISRAEDLPTIDPTKKHIVKLHGDINSPSSLIITSKDYTKYKNTHSGFVEWLTADMARNTVLFLGTSFDDPRLSDSDDHVINLFGGMKRRHFIVLKMPDVSSVEAEESEQILGDFEAVCEDFSDRGFFVIVVADYEEIRSLINKLHEKVISNKIKNDPSDLRSTVLLQSKQIGDLEEALGTLVDNKTLELCEYVRGNGRLPSSEEMLARVSGLIEHLENPPVTLQAESLLEGWIAVADAFVISEKKDGIINAKKYFKKAQLSFENIKNNSGNWQARLVALQTKILFAEGEIDLAIEAVENATDNKIISTWLALLLDADRIDEAYQFIDKQPIQAEWLLIALYAFVLSGKDQEAEQLFLKTTDEIQSLEQEKQLEESFYKNIYFLEKMSFAMANGFYLKALRLSGKETTASHFPDDINDEGRRVLDKSLYYVDRLLSRFKYDSERNYFYIKTKQIELFASYLTQDFERADKTAIEIVEFAALSPDVINYLILRRNSLVSKFDVESLIKRLEEEYSQEVWGVICLASIQELYLNDAQMAWQSLQKAAGLVTTDREKEEIARSAFEVSQQVKETTEAKLLVNDLLPAENLWRIFLSACFFIVDGEIEKAQELFLDLEQQDIPPEIQAKIKGILGVHAIKNDKWSEAKLLLKESLRILPDIHTLKHLLRVLAMLQDDQESLSVAKDIEGRGVDDDQVTAIKAQAARNLGLFKESEKAYRQLVNSYPKRAEYSFHLAETLSQLDNLNEALNVLRPFIDCNQTVDLDCLRLTCEIYSTQDKDKKAIDLLETCFDFIEDEPLLLLKHLDLWYRTESGKELEQPKSALRLQILKQQGKVADELFSMKSLDDLVTFFNKRHETAKKIDTEYRNGQLVRLMLCEWNNKSLYLDWAVRTQELHLDGENTPSWVKHTTYITNGMRVDLLKKHKQLEIFTIPPDTKEIVIDYHALITIHRLGLLEKVNNVFSTIHYPQILNLIWRIDQKQFKHHQRSKEIVYHSLSEKIDRRQLREIEAPEPLEKIVIEDDSFIKRNIRLASLEKLPIFDEFTSENELDGYQYVFRISQIASWLYSKGKLTETQLSELKNISGSSTKIVRKLENGELDKISKLLVENTTLEIIEQYGLLQPLLDLGVSIIIEKASANYFRVAVSELRFGEKVGKWHKDLAQKVKHLASFKDFRHQYGAKEKEKLANTPYRQMISDCLLSVESKNLLVMTDDRRMQMAIDQYHRNKSFGTDIVLKFLYEKEIISIGEYADKFLQLCKWRYRFLIPDKRILVYFAQEYKHNPSGEPLRIIGDYGRSCMKDPGLFMGLEQTEPPIPLGLKLQIKWVAVWTEFLCLIWQDDEFANDSLELFTQDVYIRFFPDLPHGLVPSLRKNVDIVHKDSVVMRVFVAATNSNTPARLHGLLNQLFNWFQYSESQKESAVILYLKSIVQSVSATTSEEKNVRKIFANNVMATFYGEIFLKKGKVQYVFVPILQELGVSLSGDNKIVTEKYKNSLAKRKLPFHRRSFHRRNMPEYIPDGPLIITKAERKESSTILIPHYSILSPLRRERIDVLADILSRDDVSDYTKQIIKQGRDRVKSPDALSWQSEASKIARVLLADFTYSRSLFTQLVLMKKPDIEVNQLVNEAWNSVMIPDLGSVISKMPLLLADPFESKQLTQRIEESVANTIRTTLSQQIGTKNLLHVLFDWYLDNVYFVPVSSPLNPSSFLISAWKGIKDKEFGVPTSFEIFTSAKSWVKGKTDPFAYLMVMELILYARATAEKTDQEFFAQEIFYLTFDELFEKLLFLEDNVAPASIKMMKAVWEMRKSLTRYYIMYLDLHDDTEMPDDKKVSLSWWMAREVSIAIVASVETIEEEDSAVWIKKQTDDVLARQEMNLKFTHRIADRRKLFSLGRYYTLGEHVSPITVATLSLFWPGNETGKALLNGLKKPTTILTPEIRNKIIDRLSIHTFLGDGQLSEHAEGELSFLWDNPLCKTAPTMLREYYGDAIDLLGDEKLKAIEFAEMVSNGDFLEKELKGLPEYVQQKSEIPVVITLSALKAYVLSRGEVPDATAVFRSNRSLVADIVRFDTETGWASIFVLTQLLVRLYAAGNYKWANILGDQVAQIDYGNCKGKVLGQVLSTLVELVLMGYSYSILKPLLILKTENKEIRQSLGGVKFGLEYVFPRIPGEYQENARKILNDLADIPIPQTADLYEEEQ
jgi:tetratricopeptide (TPR) repeat protein